MNARTIFYPRLIEARVAEAMADTPVVLIAGPRQAGKTTLVQSTAKDQGLHYLTLDDELTLLAARESNLRGLKRLAGIAGDKFSLDVILYDGAATMPLGDRLWAAPISTLWGTLMKQILQNLKTGVTEVAEVPCPNVGRGLKTAFSGPTN